MKQDKLKVEFDSLFKKFSIANKINTDNFHKIIKDNKDTKYGKKYDFANIKSTFEYANKVPLTSYSAYRDKITKADDYTVYQIKDVLLTSGSTGKQKVFPITTEAFNRYSSYIYDYPHYLKQTDKVIHTSVFRQLTDQNNILSASYYRWMDETGAVDFSNMVGGRQLLFSNDIFNVPYVKTWLMFSCPDLSAIESIYLYDMLMFFKWLEDNWKTVIDDMRNRRVSIDFKDSVKEELLKNLPSNDFINQIETELNKGFDTPFVPRLFKNLKFVSGIGGNLYSIQEKQLDKYIGDIPKYKFAYALSECIVGMALDFNKSEYVLLPDNAYYEFLTKDDSKLTMLEDLEVGKTYELVLTTFSGLYRYRTGDLLKVLRFEGEAPVFEVSGKIEQVIDIAGEKLDSVLVIEAINKLAGKYKIEVHDFAFGINTSVNPFGYHVFIENKKVVEDNSINDYLDDILCKLSADYADLRTLGLLSKPKINFVDYGKIQKSMEEENKLRHNKPQIFLNEFRTNYLLRNCK